MHQLVRRKYLIALAVYGISCFFLLQRYMEEFQQISTSLQWLILIIFFCFKFVLIWKDSCFWFNAKNKFSLTEE